MAGFPAYSTEQMPTGDMLFGDFSQLVIAEWGRLSISINPFADFRAGIIGVRGLWTLDLAVRHAKSFSLATSIT